MSQEEVAAPQKMPEFENYSNPEAWIKILDKNAELILGSAFANLCKMNIDDPKLDIGKADKIINRLPYSKSILRASNMSYLSENEQTLPSIQRAMVLMGFQSIRNIALILGVFEHVLHNSNDSQIQREVALATHSGILAAMMEKQRYSNRNVEPTIVTSWLLSLGKILCIYLGGEKGKYFSTSSEKSYLKPSDEKSIFGFTCHELVCAFAKQFFVDIKITSIDDAISETHNYNFILSARDLSFNLMRSWKSKSSHDSISKVASWLKVKNVDLKDFLMESINQVFEELSLYDVPELLDFILLPDSEEEELELVEEFENGDAHPDSEKLQKNIAHIKSIGAKSKKIGELLAFGTNAILESLNFDRILIALLDKNNKNFLKQRIYLQDSEYDPSDLPDIFEFELDKPEGWLFGHVLRERNIAWVGNKGSRILRRYRNNQLLAKLGTSPFFLSP